MSKPESVEKRILVKSNGREMEVELTKQEKIGYGLSGEVYKAEVAMGQQEREKIERQEKEEIQKIRKKIFAIKEFLDNDSDRCSKNALAVHSALKKVGVDTWTTYRKVKDKNHVVMTYGEQEGEKLVSSGYDKSRSKNDILDRKFRKLRNFEEAIKKTVEDVIKAAKGGLYVTADSFFCVFSDVQHKSPFSYLRGRDGVIKNVFIGDYDKIKMDESNKNSELEIINLLGLFIFTKLMLSRFTAFNLNRIRLRVSAEKIIAGTAREIDKKSNSVGRWEDYVKLSKESAVRRIPRTWEEQEWQDYADNYRKERFHE